MGACEAFHYICDIPRSLKHLSDLKSVKIWPNCRKRRRKPVHLRSLMANRNYTRTSFWATKPLENEGRLQVSSNVQVLDEPGKGK